MYIFVFKCMDGSIISSSHNGQFNLLNSCGPSRSYDRYAAVLLREERVQGEDEQSRDQEFLPC